MLCLVAGAAQAQQIVAFDVTYTASTTTTKDAHFDVKPRADQPADWTSPINYSTGTVYIHQEVTSKPSAQDTMVDICFDGDLEGYGCIGTDFYTTTGAHETVEKMSTMWQYNKVAWNKKRTLFQLIVKDRGNHNGGLPVSDFMPTTMRIVLTVVPTGGTYVPPASSTGGDGGVVADAGGGIGLDAAADAGMAATGGSGGSAGAMPSGSGGSSSPTPSGSGGASAADAGPPTGSSTGGVSGAGNGDPSSTSGGSTSSGGCVLAGDSSGSGDPGLPTLAGSAAVALALAARRRARSADRR
ncbi:MAG TPA: hypothetical protein VH374_23330 [Polyangia bacterium]|jgi:hypothetical protein|nr:hypothetical protein [Polyangia bacterium]